MTDQNKHGFRYWLIGLFTGGAVAAPITAIVCKNIYEKKLAEATENGYNNGINDMAQYAVEHQTHIVTNTETAIPSEEDIDKYDLSIDDEEASEKDRERTEAHERYLDMIDKYNGNDQLSPHVISAEDFDNESYMEKSYVDWYAHDNVFVKGLDVVDDPYLMFGVTDGNELFKNSDIRNDPNIVYVRNEKISTDFEITRIFGAYSVMVGGEPGLGETDS